MSGDELREHVRQWVERTLSVPSVLFNNLPPCPYAREALLKNRVDIRAVHGGALLETVTGIARSWDDQHELVLVGCEQREIAPEALSGALEALKAEFEARDLISFFDHPACTDPKFKVRSGNGKYVIVGVQRLANFIQAAKPLYKKQYFAHATKQFQFEQRLNPQEEK